MEPDKQLPALVEPPICRPPDCRACTALIAATLEDWSGLPLVTLEASSASSEHWQQSAPENSLEHLCLTTGRRARVSQSLLEPAIWRLVPRLCCSGKSSCYCWSVNPRRGSQRRSAAQHGQALPSQRDVLNVSSQRLTLAAAVTSRQCPHMGCNCTGSMPATWHPLGAVPALKQRRCQMPQAARARSELACQALHASSIGGVFCWLPCSACSIPRRSKGSQHCDLEAGVYC